MAKKGRGWLVNEDLVVAADDQSELEYAIRQALLILERAGGAVGVRCRDGVVTIGAVREPSSVEYEPGFEGVGPLYDTTAFVFRWQSFLPALEEREDPLPEPELEMEPDEPEAVEEPAAA
jgi:hypothetical protein